MQVNVNSYLYRLVLIFFIALHIISTPRATKLIIKVSVNAKKMRTALGASYLTQGLSVFMRGVKTDLS